VYVAGYLSGSGGALGVIDGTSDSLITTIPIGGSLVGLAVNPVTNMIYVGWNSIGEIVVDGSTNIVVTTIPLVYPYGGCRQ
jgi:DNA-binding beta-propeller fold protein YncE